MSENNDEFQIENTLKKYQDLKRKKQHNHLNRVIWTFWFLLKSAVSFIY